MLSSKSFAILISQKISSFKIRPYLKDILKIEDKRIRVKIGSIKTTH
jgi:hypothetical protein